VCTLGVYVYTKDGAFICAAIILRVHVCVVGHVCTRILSFSTLGGEGVFLSILCCVCVHTLWRLCIFLSFSLFFSFLLPLFPTVNPKIDRGTEEEQ